MNQVIILSGPPGAGKTAVAEALCERFDRMLHVEVDELRHWVKAGYRHPWAGDHQAEEQLELAVRNASAIARECVAMRYAVVISDVVLARQAAFYSDALAGLPTSVHLVTLLPSLEVALARGGSLQERARELYALIADELRAGRLPGATLDSSADANPQATADRVQELVSTGDGFLVGERVAPGIGGFTSSL